MRVGDAHLTYCTNIHPAESWAEVRANLETHVRAVKARVCPDAPFGVGLRLSARAATELEPEIKDLRRWLDDNGLYVFTINGFPYGPFHGEPVKEHVYRPDWTEPARVTYTTQLAWLLAELLPDGVAGTISTVPGCFQARVDPGAEIAIATRLGTCTNTLALIEKQTGKQIVLALEPEPACLLETVADAIALFERHQLDREHLGLCLDVCHAAVEFEDLAGALAALRAAGVPIAKIQLGAGLRVTPVDPTTRRALERFAEGVYLHQVVARRGDQLVRFVDLPEALADASFYDEWRVHFHVPIFRERFGELGSTQEFLAAVLAAHRERSIAPHLEVETYTWDVLPTEFRDEPIADAVARELRWVLERL
jgi:sugar phosphate isomerase/epimerase